jgi:hypothetical protein
MHTDGEEQDSKFTNPHQFEGKGKIIDGKIMRRIVFIGVYRSLSVVIKRGNSKIEIKPAK